MPKLRRLVPFFGMGLLLVVMFWRALSSGYILAAADTLYLQLPWKHLQSPKIQNPYVEDSILQFYPWALYFKESISRGELPLWNPYASSGQPFLANSQSRPLDPFNVLFLAFKDFVFAFNLILILQLYAAGVFAYLYLRRSLKVGRFGAFLGGTLFMLNGVFAAWLEWRWMVGGVLWLPLIFLLLDKSWQRKSFFYAVAAGIPLAASFLGGMIQSTLGILFTLWLYSAIRGVIEYRAIRQADVLFRAFRLVGTATVVGISLAAVQLFPVIELLAQSQRSFDLRCEFIAWLGGLPKNLLLSILLIPTFINPFWAGVQSLDFRTFIIWPTFGGNPTEYQGYVGIAALILAFLAVRYAGSKDSIVFFWLGLLTLVLSFSTPVNLFLYYRVFFAYTFAVSVLAGLGAHWLVSSKTPGLYVATVNRWLVRFLVILLALLLGGTVILYFAKPQILEIGEAYIKAHPLPGPDTRLENLEAFYRNYLITSPTMYWTPLVLGAVILVFNLYRRSTFRLPIFQFALLSVVSAELLYFGIRYTPIVSASYFFPRTATTDFLLRDKSLYRILPVRDLSKDFLVMPPNTNMPYRLHSVIGYDSLLIKRYSELMRLIETGTTSWMDQRCAPKFYQVEWPTRYDSKLLDMLNVKYLLVRPGVEIREDKFRNVFAGELNIYENKNFFSRAFLVPKARIVATPKAVLEALLSDDFDPGREVILEARPPERAQVDHANGKSSVEFLSYSAQRVTLRTHLAEDEFLVLADSYYPGWKALVNGIVVPIYRANYVLRAVFLKRGQSIVEFVYDPLSFRLGKWTSFSSLLLVLAILLYGAWNSYASQKMGGVPSQFKVFED